MTRQEGFTLVELLVVVMILGALAGIGVPRMTAATANRAKINACKTNVNSLNSQLEMRYANNGTWPNALSNVTGNAEYFPDGVPLCLFALAHRYDSTTHRVAQHNHDRATPASEPEPVAFPRCPPPASPFL